MRDIDTVCRYGSDEFVILIEQIGSKSEAEKIIDKLKSKFPISIMKDNHKCNVVLSIGYSIFPKDGTNYEQLFLIADSKMYDSKNSYYGYA